MGALLGAGLGALLGVAGGYEKAQAQKRMDEHGAFMDMLKAHPEIANDPDVQAAAKKKNISPEYLQLVGAVGKGNAAFQGDVQKATADSPAGQLMGAPGGTQGPQGTAQPAAGVDPLVQHIQMVDRNIANLEKLLPKYMNDPAKVKVIQDTLSEFRQHRAEYATAQEHQETRTQQKSEFEQNQGRMEQFHAESMASVAASRAATEQARTSAQQSLEAARTEKMESDRRGHFDSWLKDQEKLVGAYTNPAKPKIFDTEANAQKVANFHNSHIESARKKWGKLTDTTDTDWDSYKLQVEPVPGVTGLLGPKGYHLVPVSGGSESAAGETKAAGVKSDWADKYAK